MDGKSTHFTVHVSPSIFSIHVFNSPLHPASIKKCSGIYIENPNVDRETCTTVLSVFLALVPTQKMYLSLCRALIFCFTLVHTQIRQASNYYIIIYTMKKHHFTWTCVLNCLIVLLSFFKFKLTITHNDALYLVLSLYQKF